MDEGGGSGPVNKMGLHFFILDSIRVLPKAPLGAGIRWQNTSQIQMLLASYFEKGERSNACCVPGLARTPARLGQPCTAPRTTHHAPRTTHHAPRTTHMTEGQQNHNITEHAWLAVLTVLTPLCDGQHTDAELGLSHHSMHPAPLQPCVFVTCTHSPTTAMRVCDLRAFFTSCPDTQRTLCMCLCPSCCLCLSLPRCIRLAPIPSIPRATTSACCWAHLPRSQSQARAMISQARAMISQARAMNRIARVPLLPTRRAWGCQRPS